MTRFSPAPAFERIRGWVRGLPTLWVVLIAAVVAAGVGLAGYYAYETYDYVEHDNDFCLSCHLMEDPYERFAQSAHRDLSCKACHQPTFRARSQMALTQIVQQPDSLVTHAEVPNQRCVDCHVEGDPAKWRQIASSAGHRIHFESDDSSLQGLKCVECHSTSLHEFAAADATCQQSGCHEDTEIRLGGMSRLTIHCVACHDFSTPVSADSVPTGRDSLLAVALRPQREECLSCHAMREQLPNLPPAEEDPHRAACGACHQPHEQATPAEAVDRCTDCHTRADTLTAFHRGLQAGVLERCGACHEAHDFRVEGENCGACHRSMDEGASAPAGMRISSDPGPAGEAGARPPRSRAPRAGAGSGPYARDGGPRPTARPAPLQEAPGGDQQEAPPDTAIRYVAPSAGDTTRFRHRSHEGLECAACHATDRTHGRVKITGLAGCRSCHHTDEAGVECAACHREASLRDRTYRLPRTLTFSTGDTVRRPLPFDHGQHGELACGECHGSDLARSARGTGCADCHAEHHEPEASCGACHRPAPEEAHPLETVHLTCGGAGCHEPARVPASSRARQVCLACHAELSDHRPERDCVACHLLPPARGASP